MLRINDVLSTVESVVDACCNDKIEVLLVPAGGFTRIFSKLKLLLSFLIYCSILAIQNVNILYTYLLNILNTLLQKNLIGRDLVMDLIAVGNFDLFRQLEQ